MVKRLIFILLQFLHLPYILAGEFQLDSGIRIQTKYVKRASLRANKSLQPYFSIVKTGDPHGFYLDGLFNFPVKNRALFKDELNFSSGYLYRPAEILEADIGFLYTCQPNHLKGNLGQNREVYVGVNADVILRPSFYIFYDFDRRQFSIDYGVGYEFDLDEFGLANFAIDTNFNVGGVMAKRAYGGVRGNNYRKNSYWYMQSAIDLVFYANDSIALKIGLHWYYNRDKVRPDCVANEYSKKSNSFWWVASANLRF